MVSQDEGEFSADSAAEVRAAGNRLLLALRDHIESASRVRAPAHLTALDDSADAVRDALADYADAQVAHCGEAAPFDELVEADEQDEIDQEPGTALLSRLSRTDFMIVDEAALLEDGARAGVESGRTPPAVLDPKPMTVRRALRLILQARGPDGLWRAGGVRPLWSETILLRPDPVEIEDAADDPEPDDDPLAIFDVDGQIVAVDSEQFFR